MGLPGGQLYGDVSYDSFLGTQEELKAAAHKME